MPVFERVTELAAVPEEVFTFHENPQNIRKISPFFLHVVEVMASPEAKINDVFTLRLRIFGWPLTWTGKWAEVQNPTLLIDTASLFPFRKWRHEHHFEEISGGTRMRDVVTYELPFGWLGRVLASTVFRLQLIIMFAGRHSATRAYFARR